MSNTGNSIELKEGEVLCPICKGSCQIYDPKKKRICYKCGGSGKIDWVSLCTGRSKISDFDVEYKIEFPPQDSSITIRELHERLQGYLSEQEKL